MFFGDFHAEIKQTIKDQGMDIEPTVGKFMASKMEEGEEVTETEEVEEVTSREGSRIEGLLSIPLKAKFLEAFQDLYFDLVEEDPFAAEDVIDHLGIEMLKHLDAVQAQGDRLAGIAEEDSVEEEKTTYVWGDVRNALKDEAKASDIEIEAYIESLESDIKLNGMDDYKNFTLDDYVEDFKNYVADKSLQEHFGRFMKDYQ
jgi:hypothetical protein